MNASIPTDQQGRKSRAQNFLLIGCSAVFILACNLASNSPLPTQTPIVITATAPAATEVPTESPTDSPVDPTATSAEAGSTATSAPTCTVLQDLNLRPGPGTAYNPPITALQEGVDFVPIGFNPQGVPGGPWVQARVDSINQTGWVSAGEQFVSCSLNLTSLPSVEVPPPPKPAPPRVGTGGVDGDNISAFRFSFDYTRDYFVRMYVFRSDDPDEVFSANKDGRGINSVEFRVANENKTVYESTERNAGYCIFGGGEPECNPWILENSVYKWGAGGEPVEEGDYKMTITVTAEDGEVGQWFIDVNVNLP